MEASLVRAVRLCLTTVVSEHFGNISEQGDLLKRLAGTDLQLQSKGDLVRQQLKMWRALLALRLGANQPLFAAGAARLHCCFCNPPCSQCHSCNGLKACWRVFTCLLPTGTNQSAVDPTVALTGLSGDLLAG